jgi:agmatine/peptidylarginine deiminase
MKRFYPNVTVTLLLLLVSTFLIAQEREVLPKGLTNTEKGILSNYQFSNTRMTPPPSGPVRAAAEWEEIEYLVITWESNFQNILRQIVAVGVNECKVIITTQNQTSVASYLTAGGIDLTNVIFMDEDWDSIWIRDYAGNTIYSDDVGELALTDWIYNRPRPNDNIMPSAHASLLGIPIYITDTAPADLVNTGGNYMSDGLGNAFASKLILDENAAGNPYGVTAKSEQDIDDIMMAYMGIQNYIKMETLPYDAIHHIDMHMKLLDEETIMVSRYPEGVADGPQIEENIDYVLSNFLSPFGTPYEIEWIPAPPSAGGQYPDTGGSYRTYSNAVFINKSIIVPTYRPEVDTPALAQWQELMPGYNIVGIDVDNAGENLIALFGAIHCITHSIGVDEPLWIVHQPVDEANQNTTVTIDAMAKHISGMNNLKVLWRAEGTTTFNETPMTLVSDDTWTANLNVTTNNIEYYILAEANSGKTLARPIVAPEGYWTINVGNLSVTDWAETHISAPFPNPTSGNVSFNLNNIQGPVQVTIHNLLGQQLFETQLEGGNGILNLDLHANWKGTLFVTFEGDFGRVNKKIIKL